MLYTKEIILKAAELANISKLSAELIICMLNKAKTLINYIEPEYTVSSIETLFQNVCFVAKVTPEQLKSRNRLRELSYIRHVFVAIAHEMFPKANLDYIGSFINKRHDMVYYYIKGICMVKEKNEKYKEIKQLLRIEFC